MSTNPRAATALHGRRELGGSQPIVTNCAHGLARVDDEGNVGEGVRER